MGEAKNFPKFLTDLMVKWLDFYEHDTVDKITCLGLFVWKETTNKKKPTVLKKQAVLDSNHKLLIRTLPLDYSIYFHEVNESCLQVLHIKGIVLEAKSTIFEYYFEGKGFRKIKKKLL